MDSILSNCTASPRVFSLRVFWVSKVLSPHSELLSQIDLNKLLKQASLIIDHSIEMHIILAKVLLIESAIFMNNILYVLIFFQS